MITIEQLSLLLLDVDGTITERHGYELHPQARMFFERLRWRLLAGMRIPHLALASNQGGVAIRLWMEESRFGEPEKYPTLQMVQERMAHLVGQIPLEVRVYVAYAYQNERTRQWAPTPITYAGREEWSRSWRKPGPGMIRKAMADVGLEDPSRVMMVGDQMTDREAAVAAGIHFRFAGQFWQEVNQFLGLVPMVV